MSSERQAADKDNPWWGEHLHRYIVAAQYISPGSKVLDIACGSGFGSLFLAEKGFTVIGGDISSETVELCNKAFSHPHLKFEVIDGTAINYGDQYFDAVVSFETIEHTTGYMKVLQEFRRITKRNGIIIVSTPNIEINSPGGKVLNPFHTQEWNYEEIHKILHTVFSSVELYGQQYSRYTGQKSMRMSIGKNVERFLYLRGVRKIPLGIQNAIMKFLTKLPMYPTEQDYTLVNDAAAIKKCKTFFAVCKP